MAILNYTTQIDPHKTVGEIQTKLVKAGVAGYSVQIANGEPVAVVFTIELLGQYVNYRLPSRWQGVYKVLSKDKTIERKYRTEEQAKRVAWRIVKDWIESQLAFIEAGLAELPEVFLPYAVKPDGRTVYDEFKESLNLLGDGS